MFAAWTIARKSPATAAAAGEPQSAQNAPAANLLAPGGASGKTVVVAEGVATRALAVDARGALYLTTAAAPNRIFLLSAAHATSAAPASALAPVAGSGQAGSLGDGGAAVSGQLDLMADAPAARSGIAVGLDGTIFIADTRNSTVRRVAGASSTEPGIIRSVAGRWAARQNVALAGPAGLALDRAGNLYIADLAAGAIDVLHAGTGQLETLAHVAAPASIAVTADGRKLFVASAQTGAVIVIDAATRALQTLPGFSPSPDASPCATLQAAAGAVSQPACPAGLAVDGRGNLFVADARAGRILRVDARTLGTSIIAASLSAPGALALDAAGNLYLADQGTGRILEILHAGIAATSISLTAPPAFPAPCPQVTAPYTFCNEPQGGNTATAAFTLTNSSATDATAVTMAFNPSTTPGNFTIASKTCTTTLPANSSCTINIAFTPQATGVLAATLNVTDSNPADLASVNLAGTGDDYSLALINSQPLEVTVAAGGSVTFSAQVNPDSVFGLDGEKVTFVCPSNIPANTSCAITPCPASITAGTPSNFQITFVTSSATKVAPIPAPGCSGYGPILATASPGPPGPGLRARGGPGTGVPRFPAAYVSALALLAIATMLALAFGGLNARGGRAWKRVPLALACAGFAVVAIFAGCGGHGAAKVTSATPPSTTTMQLQGTALDSHGNPLNASRSLHIILNVTAK
jgi:sugar lactone lactonase YvrE